MKSTDSDGNRRYCVFVPVKTKGLRSWFFGNTDSSGKEG